VVTDDQANPPHLVEARTYWPEGDALAGTSSTSQRLRFATMERDTESNHFYDHARAHDFNLGRFLGVDKHGGHAEDPQSWNRYAYARDNPLKYVDPNGREIKVSYTQTPTGRQYHIAITAEFSGRGGVDPRGSQVRSIVQATEKAFTGQFGRFNIDTRVDAKITTGGTDPSRLQVVVDPSNDRAQTNQIGGNTVTMNPTDSGLIGAHEFGHTLGLDEKYHDTESGSVANPGYENNVMGTGALHGQSLLTPAQAQEILESFYSGVLNQGVTTSKSGNCPEGKTGEASGCTE
jgi:RHS repeat-associated protein